VEELTSQHVEDYFKQRLKDEPTPSPTTICLEMTALSALLNYCRKRGWISANPCVGVARPQAKIIPRRMSTKELGALMSLLSHKIYRFRAEAWASVSYRRSSVAR
jgi:site-specific recombinase XerC